MKTRGEISLLVLGIIALLGVGGWGLSKTKFFHGESKRADQSTKTTEALVSTQEKAASVAAASVVKIGEANQTAPESPEKLFIGREVPVALASLPKPDSEALLAAERRKTAVLEGRVVEANALYGQAMQRADQIQRELAKAIAAKRAADLALEEAAAESRGAEQQAFWAICGLGAIAALYLWVKITHFSPGQIATLVTDIRSGQTEPNQALAALDNVSSGLQQKIVRTLHKLKTP